MLLFEQPDAVEVILNHVLLFVGFANFIIVGRHACDVVKHLSTFIGRHLGQTRNIALKHDVVAIRSSVRSPQQAVKHLLRAVFTVELVGRDRVV